MKHSVTLALCFLLLAAATTTRSATTPATNGPTAQMSVHIVGPGTVSPNYDGQWLQVGQLYHITAKPAKGCGFVRWTGTNGFASRSFRLNFVMQSNLAFTVYFADVKAPSDVIVYPRRKQSGTNGAVTVSGKAADNVGVTYVWYQLNGTGWSVASSTNNWTNWTASVTFHSGLNTIQSYAVDAQGWNSRIVGATYDYTVVPGADWAPDSPNGLLAQITGQEPSPQSVSFDTSTYNQIGATTNDFQVGYYRYSKTTTNQAELTFTPAVPDPSASNTLELTFTGPYSGSFSNAAGGQTGAVTFQVAPYLVPASMPLGRTLYVTNDAGIDKIKFLNTYSFSRILPGISQTNSGSYSFVRASPEAGLLELSIANGVNAGGEDDVQLTFNAKASGTAMTNSYDSSNQLQNVTPGRFGIK